MSNRQKLAAHPGFVRAKSVAVSSSLQSIYSVLQDSEQMLINVITNKGDASIGNGQIEFGTLLYLLNNTSQIQDATAQTTVTVLLAVMEYISSSYTPPQSSLTKTQYQGLASPPFIIWSDGSVLGTEQNSFQTYDQNWLYALVNLFKGLLFDLGYNGSRFPGSSYAPVAATSMNGAGSSSICVGLVSDWGTGQDYATSVMGALVTNQAPDYIVHLGDVYYAGTPDTSPTLSEWLVWLLDELDMSADIAYLEYSPLKEESVNLLGCWADVAAGTSPNPYAGRSFTLNSNHEMYSFATGYFNTALASGLFSAQQNASTFAIAVGDWFIIGLDSAYDSDIDCLFMYGDLGQSQISWLQALVKSSSILPSKTIILTHHTGFDYDYSFGSDQSSSSIPSPQQYYSKFWQQIKSALGADPYAWYWGHNHNGIAYPQPVSIAISGSTFTSSTYCRCLGHGALPFGPATSLNSTNTTWYATAQPTGSNLLYNGYVTLDFTIANGTCSKIVENFCDYGDTAPRNSYDLYVAASA